MIEVFLFLILLQIKHWYVDFVNQTNEEIKHKSIYWHWIGVKHSLKQGIGTLWAALAVFGFEYFIFAFVVSIFDFIIHYNIDWVKMNYGNSDITTPLFWNHFGLDQLAHQLTYISIAALTIL